MHVHKKRPELNPSFFAHAFSVGLSVQRLEHATSAEIGKWVSKFLAISEDRAWLGFVCAPVHKVREVQFENTVDQVFCVYDAALQDNPAHAEIWASRTIDEADRLEHRRTLMKVFEDGQVRDRQELMNGTIWQNLPPGLRARLVPTQWST